MFEVGDIITGTCESDLAFGVTNTGMIEGEVTRVGQAGVSLKVLKHTDKNRIGFEAFVNLFSGKGKPYFELVSTLTIPIDESEYFQLIGK